MNQLVLATNNKGKLRELQALLPDFQLLSLEDIGFAEEIPEPFNSFEENALTKARTVFEFCDKPTLSDDSGICIPALNNAPGVQSAFYGGLPRSDEKNNQKLLQELENAEDRSAFYKAVICLIWDEQVYFFEGICEGAIAKEASGSGGFGYDPLFIPDGYDKTFGELPPEVKIQISHRGKAVQKMVSFLQEHISS